MSCSQDLDALTNVVSTNTIPLERTSSSSFMVHGEKYKNRWHEKILFYVIFLNLVKFLYKEVPKLSNNKSDLDIMVTMKTWNHSNFMCNNYILNGLDNTLYDMYDYNQEWKGIIRLKVRG